uniref:Uncharacterized protein n=1 Tax=Arundo donax TaxID=35708 RepID=A0A0A9B223_ARUDO
MMPAQDVAEMVVAIIVYSRLPFGGLLHGRTVCHCWELHAGFDLV